MIMQVLGAFVFSNTGIDVNIFRKCKAENVKK